MAEVGEVKVGFRMDREEEADLTRCFMFFFENNGKEKKEREKGEE